MSDEVKLAYEVLLFTTATVVTIVLVTTFSVVLCKEIKDRYSTRTTLCEKCMNEVVE